MPRRISARFLTILGALVVVGVAGIRLVPYAEAHFEMQRGRQALEAKQYPVAVVAFREVLRRRPGHTAAQEHLGTAYFRQYIPGGDTPENLELARAAREQFEAVLRSDSSNETALTSLAALHYHQYRFDDAQRMYERMAAARPGRADAYVRLATIAWNRFLPVYADARAAAGMTLQAPGRIPDSSIRRSLRSTWQRPLDKAIADLSRALELEADRPNAMFMISAIVRARGTVADTEAEYEAAVRDADTWLQRARAARSEQAKRQQPEAEKP